MSVSFERNFYFLSLEAKEIDSISAWAADHLQFRYVQVDYSLFLTHYRPTNWLTRKATALPLTLLAVIKTIYHLAKALFCGIFDCSNSLKVELFYAGRNGQEGFGYAASLLRDQYGLYHIQNSQFHKVCYNIYMARHTENNPISAMPISSQKDHPPLAQESQELQPKKTVSLKEHKRTSIKKPKNPPANHSLLKNDLSIPQPLALDYAGLSKQQLENEFPLGASVREATRKKLSTLSSDDFAIVVARWISEQHYPELLSYIPDARLNELDYSIFDNRALRYLFPRGIPNYKTGALDKDAEETDRKLRLLSPSNCAALINRCIALGYGLFYLIPDECLNEIDYARMRYTDLHQLFPVNNVALAKRRFGLLSERNFKLAFNRLCDEIKNIYQAVMHALQFMLPLVPDSHIHFVDFSSATGIHLYALFPFLMEELLEASRLKFAALSAEQVLSFFDQLWPQQYAFITREQLQDARLAEKLRAEMDRIFSIPSDQDLARYYAILELNPDASAADIRRAYYRLARRYHPDRQGTIDAEAERRIRELNEAYEVLSRRL